MGKKTGGRARLCGIWAVAVVMALSPLAGCGGAEEGAAGTLKVSGSTTVLPVAQEAASQFASRHHGARIEVQGGGSSVGIAQLKEKVVEIANSSRELKGEELKHGFFDSRIAFDIIGVVVHPANPVEDLSYERLRAVFTGKVKSWKDLGGPDREIVVIVRDLASGTREMFDEKALGATRENPVECVPSAIECASNGVVRETVASTPNAIGYLSYGYIDKRVKALTLEGIPPDLKNARAGRYPMARFLHMFTRERPRGLAGEFIDFVLSEKFQNEVIALEYVPIRELDVKVK